MMYTWRLLAALNFAIVVIFLSALLLAPIIIDRFHMDDTVLLANLAWRGVNGLSPVIDYPHFYGGVDVQFVTAAFKLFGVSYKSINYAFAIMFIVGAVVQWALMRWRIRGRDIALLVTLAAALMISLDPIEDVGLLNLAHSFVYNHFGIVVMMGLTVFACKGLEDSRAEWPAAAVAGFALYGLALLKTTFGVMLPCVVLACIVQRRWVSAMLVLAGAGAGMLAMDPGMDRAVGSLDFLLDSAAADAAGGLEGRVRHALLIVQSQAALLAICFVLAMHVLWQVGRSGLALFISVLLCGAGYMAATLTMGGDPELKLVPFLTVIALLMTERATVKSAKSPANATIAPSDVLLIRALPFCMAYAIILPALATSVQGLRKALYYSEASLVANGPFSEYIVIGPATRIPEIQSFEATERFAAAIDVVSHHIDSGLVLDDSHEYVLFADGITLLQQIPNIASYGIISNGRMFDFTMPLGSQVVPSYPVWPTSGLPGLANRIRLEGDVDLVMMLDEIPTLGLVSEDLHALMGREFKICQRSRFWTLFARRTLPNNLCVSTPSSVQAP